MNLRILILILIASGFGKIQSQELTPELLIQKVKEKYYSLNSYVDEGILYNTMYTNSGIKTNIIEKHFSTKYIRNKAFRFEYSVKNKPNSEYIVHQDENGMVTTYSGILDRKSNPESLEMGLAEATGVSGGTASYITSLLIPDKLYGKNYTFSSLKDSLYLSIKKYKNQKYYILKGQKTTNSKKIGKVTSAFELWIDYKNYVIKKIIKNSQFLKFKSHSEIIYDFKLNPKINKSEIEFRKE